MIKNLLRFQIGKNKTTINVQTRCPGEGKICWMFKTEGENRSFLLNYEEI